MGWLSRWGFALLVGLGAAAAIWVAATVQTPAEPPGFALQAAPVYRLEVGAAVFAGIYIAAMALVLALNNRAFSEIGVHGLRAHDLNRKIDEGLMSTERETLRIVRTILETLEELDDDGDGGR